MRPTPRSSSTRGATAAQFNCPSWQSGVDSWGFVTNPNAQIQQYDPSRNPANKRWNQIVQASLHTVCRVNGVNDYNSALVPVPSNQPSWSPNQPSRLSYTFYSSNYLNYART